MTTVYRPTVLERFTRIADADPDRPAIVSGATSMSYGLLSHRADALAAALRARGVAPEAPVAALLPRGVATFVVALAAWRASGAYLPLDPTLPDGRLAHLLSDARPPVVVTTADLAARLEPHGATALVIEPDGAGPAGAEPVRPHGPAATRRLAYIIYTSGTTGRPKGVLVEHGSLATMAEAHETALYDTVPADRGRVAVNNPVTTDSFFSEFAHLGFGRTLHVLNEAERRDPERMAAFLRQHRIEVLDATPTQIRALLLAGHGAALERLRVVILGGEAVDESLWSTMRDLPGVRVFNLYGPTECTVDVAAASLREHPAPVIGREWPGCEILLLDPDRRPVPDGAAGEIYVTGALLARGYLHPTPAERDRFTEIRVPGRDKDVRAYRTGDRARRNPAGLLEFLGRVDDQVKIRGHRVELAEVEAVLRECPGVRDARVGFVPDSPANPLRAWIVADPSTGVADIRRRLAGLLPDHMLPVLVPVARIPLGDTGKADLRTLLTLPPAEPDSAPSGADPGAVLHSIWREVLGVATVGAGDNFFELGGDSLAATRMTLRTREETGRRVPVRLIFDNPVFQDYYLTVDGCAR